MAGIKKGDPVAKCECGGTEFHALIGFSASATLKENGDLEIDKLNEFDDTIESITCKDCGRTYEKPWNLIKRYVFNPIVISVEGGQLTLASNPAFNNIIIQDWDAAAFDEDQLKADEFGNKYAEYKI